MTLHGPNEDFAVFVPNIFLGLEMGCSKKLNAPRKQLRSLMFQEQELASIIHGKCCRP